MIEKPADFEYFWRDTLDQLNNYSREFEKTPVDQHGGVSHFSVDFASWLDSEISGYMLHWNDTQSRPLVIYTHGYYGQYDIQWQWAELGFNVFGFDTRGFGRSIIPVHEDGWILTGIEAPENSIIRGAVCDFIRASEIAGMITRNTTSRILYYGFSFGGAMALMAEAVGQSADMVAAGVPTFGWMTGRRRLAKLGSSGEVNRYIRKHPEQEERVMRTLPYFDTVNFASLIKKPTLIGIGRKDVVVPVETVRAICDCLGGSSIIREFPHSHSSQPDESLWQNFDKEWQRMALNGELSSEYVRN